MKQKVIVADSAHDLNSQIGSNIKKGWVPIGSHQVVTRRSRSIYRGEQTLYDLEYSQTMRLNQEEINPQQEEVVNP